MQDLRYALRTLVRTPGFTVVAVLTLALGIGANTAVFSLVHSVLLKPLPFRDPARLITVWDTYLPQYPKIGASPAEVQAWKQSDLLEQAAWYRYVSKDLSLSNPGAEALEVHAGIIDSHLMPLLGVAPTIGRGFSESEPPHSVLLGNRLWRARFAGDPSISGKLIRLNEQEFTIVGVMPADYQFPDWADLWLPKGPLMGDELTNPVRHSSGFIARLRPGVTEQQAAAALETISRRLVAERPKTSTGWGLRVYGLQQDLAASMRPALLLLLGAVALVLLIACANIANLLLSRAGSRSREIAVRTALGAGSWRLVRQWVTESLLLSLLGGALGLAMAAWALDVAAPVPAPLDGSVMLFLAAVSSLTGFLAGIAPVFQTLRSDTNAILKSGAAPAGGSGPARAALVVVEFALAMLLVIGAGILARSFLRLMNVDPGFNPHGMLTLRLSIPPSRNPGALYHRLDERLRRLPGVQSVSAANTLPLVAARGNATRFYVPGASGINPDALPSANIRAVSPTYFTALGIPLRSGRAFTEADLPNPVVIVNETFARRFWPGRDPVGQKFVTGPWGPNPSYSTVIGVVGDVKQFGLDSEPTLDLYFAGLVPGFLIVKTSADPLTLATAVRREVNAVDSALPVSDVRTMDRIVAESAKSRRWTMALLVAFAGLALVLALIGIYGVMAWTVAQRTREIGIRMALGAARGQVVALVLRYGMKLSLLGLAIGGAGAFAARQVLATQVFGISTADPWVYGGVGILMLLVSLLACYVPARRASRVDPLTALRWE